MALNQFNGNACSNKFRTNVDVSTVNLSFREPYDGGSITENVKACMWMSGHLITSLVGINEAWNKNWVSRGYGSIKWIFSLCVRVKGTPVHFEKLLFIDHRFCWIHYNFRSWMLFQIGKHMNLIQVSYMGCARCWDINVTGNCISIWPGSTDYHNILMSC